MPARGHTAGGDQMRRIPIGFDAETFAEIDVSAAKQKIAFAARVRQLVELGLETEQQERVAACSTPATGSRGRSSGSSRS